MLFSPAAGAGSRPYPSHFGNYVQSKPVHTGAQSLTAQTTKHSWYGHRCHIVRDNGQLVRATVLALNVYEHHWGFKCTYFDFLKRRRRNKLVSPMSLITVQALWEKSEVLSEDESKAGDQHFLEYECLHQNWTTQPETSLLRTPLTLQPDVGFCVSEAVVKSLQWSLNEVQLVSNVLTPCE